MMPHLVSWARSQHQDHIRKRIRAWKQRAKGQGRSSEFAYIIRMRILGICYDSLRSLATAFFTSVTHLLLVSFATILCQCVTSLNLSHLLQIHETDSLQTLQYKTGIRYCPHDLQEAVIGFYSKNTCLNIIV
jgi:hypothetical protein